MNKAFEKILERLEELRETYDEMAFIEMNTNGHTLDFEYAKGKKDVMLDAKQIVQEVEEEYHGGWIPCSERLPEEKINPVTKDYYEYPVTYKNNDVVDIRYYKFGNGHWYHGFQIMDDYVTAWQPLPEPYKESEG